SLLQIGSTAETAGSYKFQGFLNSGAVCSNGDRLKGLNATVEEDEIELVFGLQGTEQSFERLVAAFEFFPLHGERRIEQDHDGLWGGIRAGASLYVLRLNPGSASAAKKPGSLVLRTGAISVGDG